MNKKKIINDPVYGFVNIPSALLFDLIQHPYFQRLRRIKQVGLAEFVYPGALHTRFSHALGAMHLMGQALSVLETKGTMIFDSEREASQIAILLHDIGHGPFSHVLEYTLMEDVHHEDISQRIMQELNEHFNGLLSLAIDIFNGSYSRGFFHELVSSQLDMDRLDYLNRDCFFTGVVEGTIGVDRIIKMLQEVDGQLVVEEKGLLSVENFLNARRLMYWQVYLHKTSLAAEQMLIQLINRVKELIHNGEDLFATPSLRYFLANKINKASFNTVALGHFVQLDDTDIWTCIKVWASHDDTIIKTLANGILTRHLFKIQLSNEPINHQHIKKSMIKAEYTAKEIEYLLMVGTVSNKGYLPSTQSINILKKNGQIIDIAEASDLPTIKALSVPVTKHYVCYPRDLIISGE